MWKLGKAFVFVSALLWITAGSVVFSRQVGDRARVAQATDYSAQAHVASAGAANDYYKTPTYNPLAPSEDSATDSTVTDKSGDNPWEGPYYVDGNDSSASQDIPVVTGKPWYVEVFGGFGSIFQNIFSSNSAGEQVSRIQYTATAKQLPPACTISIIPNSVPYGGSATVTWTSRNADHVVFQGLGEVARSGSFPVKDITSTRALALAVVGSQGSSSCYTVVNVEPVVVYTPTCVISAHPSVIKAGESASLSWGSEHADSASLSDGGSVDAVGGTTVNPLHTTTYTLTVHSLVGDTASCETAVTVE